MIDLTESEIELLKKVVDEFDGEDKSVRDRQILKWKRLKLFWDGFTNIWYSEVAHDWRVYNSENEVEQASYDKSINVFKAYLESIIAALSVTVPAIKCYPDDADNSLDLMTAKAGDKIAQIISRHNDVSLLWLHALFIYCTEGLIAAHTYTKSDKKFGTWKENKLEDVEERHATTKCPECGHTFEDVLLDKEEFKFNDESIEEACPNCGQSVLPSNSIDSLMVTRLIGVTEHPKTRQGIDVYGGTYVKVPIYAKKQEDCPYLIFSYETHFALARDKYLNNKKLREKISNSTADGPDNERRGRASNQYQGESSRNTVTVKNVWLRNSAFEVLDDEEAKSLKEKFPAGARVVYVDDVFAEAENELLDDAWTLTYNPLSDNLHHEPLGSLLISVQEITTDLISLILQTIEHGIPQTFADPGVLDFIAYQKTEVSPGSIFPAIPKSGKALGDAFYEVRTATLSQEVLPFSNMVQSYGQTVSGALPSLFGGQLEGSKTASEYSMSRAQALQRLQTTWKMLTVWWKQIFSKVIPAYIRELKEDEKFVEQDEFGNFLNVYIRRAELEGKIGNIELESSENLPMTWFQQKDAIMQLFQLNNPKILETLMSAENLPKIREAIGLNDIYVPGEDDRNKQYEEIKQLLESDPIMEPANPEEVEQAMMTGMQPPQDIERPSVEIDTDFDNHTVQFEICRKWIVSDAGRLAKTENEVGYKNVLLHAREHQMAMQVQMQSQMQQASAQPNQEAPVEEENV